MTKELYLLADGTHADPDECDLGADNELRHANGVPVALDATGNPQTLAGLVVDSKNTEAAAAGKEAQEAPAESEPKSREEEPDPVESRVTKPVKKRLTR